MISGETVKGDFFIHCHFFSDIVITSPPLVPTKGGDVITIPNWDAPWKGNSNYTIMKDHNNGQGRRMLM